jgi:hypothetical protein
MTKSNWVWIGLAALAPVAGGCKPKTTAEATPTASASVAAVPSPAKATAAAPAAAAAFEGEIQLAVYEPNSKPGQTMVYDVKGDKVRAQPAGNDAGVARVVGDRKDKKVFAVVDASKSYASVDVEGKAPLPPVTRTGKVEHVLGHDCEDWTINDGGERFDLCAAKGIAYLDPAAGAGEPAWAAVLTREHAFPLKVVATDKAGKQEFRAEATKIEVRRLDDALFKVPADYHSAPLGKSVKVASIP